MTHVFLDPLESKYCLKILFCSSNSNVNVLHFVYRFCFDFQFIYQIDNDRHVFKMLLFALQMFNRSFAAREGWGKKKKWKRKKNNLICANVKM